MKGISVSNLAWPVGLDAEATELAVELGFAGVEIAPSRVFPAWPEASISEAVRYRSKLADGGLSVPSLQAILYGVSGVELFASRQSRERLVRHFGRVAMIAGAMGAAACVYGAPTQRDPGELEPREAMEIATELFSRIAPIFEREGTCLAIEANATDYGCRFLTRTAEVIAFVRKIEQPGVRVQLDTGTIFLMEEDPGIVAQAVPLAAHFHASEPWLAPLGSTGNDHRAIAAALGEGGYTGWRSVEMRETGTWRQNMQDAARLMEAIYT